MFLSTLDHLKKEKWSDGLSDGTHDAMIMMVRLGRSKVTDERHSFDGSP